MHLNSSFPAHRKSSTWDWKIPQSSLFSLCCVKAPKSRDEQMQPEYSKLCLNQNVDLLFCLYGCCWIHLYYHKDSLPVTFLFSDCSAILESWGYSTNRHSSMSAQSVKYWTESFVTLRPSLSPFLKSLFPLPCLFSVPPLLSYFRQFPCPHTTPYCPNWTN